MTCLGFGTKGRGGGLIWPILKNKKNVLQVVSEEAEKPDVNAVQRELFIKQVEETSIVWKKKWTYKENLTKTKENLTNTNENSAELTKGASDETSPVQVEATAEQDTIKTTTGVTSTEENCSPVRKSSRTPRKTRKALESYDDTLQQQPPRKLARTESSPEAGSRSAAHPTVAEGKDGPDIKYVRFPAH